MSCTVSALLSARLLVVTVYGATDFSTAVTTNPPRSGGISHDDKGFNREVEIGSLIIESVVFFSSSLTFDKRVCLLTRLPHLNSSIRLVTCVQVSLC